MYIYSSTSIDIKIKFEIPFHPNPRRAYNISSKPKSTNLSSQKVRKNHFQSIKKHNAKKYTATIFIQKKERRKIQKNTIHPRSKPRFDNKKRKRTHPIMEDRQGESPVISLDSSETQSRMEIQPIPWAADSPSPTRSARACLTRESFGARSIPSDFARRQEIDYSSDGRLFLGFDGFLAFQRI